MEIASSAFVNPIDNMFVLQYLELSNPYSMIIIHGLNKKNPKEKPITE